MSAGPDDDSEDEGDVPPLLSAPPPGSKAQAAPASKPAAKPAAATAKPAPAKGAAAASGPPPPKSRVRLHGLTGRAELNGCTGEVVGPPTDNGRIPVRLGAPHNQSLALKPENLERLPEEPTVVRKAEGADPLRLDAVQKSMEEQQASASAAQVGGQPQWVTPDLLQKIAKDPLLRKAFTDPRCSAAMTALQTDPQGAMATYGHNPEMREFLQAFMKLMGDHFTALGEAQGGAAAAPPQPKVQPVTPISPEEAAVRKAMQDPEVAAILQDPEVQALIRKLQEGQSAELERASQRPDMVVKLRKLSQAGLIGMHWER